MSRWTSRRVSRRGFLKAVGAAATVTGGVLGGFFPEARAYASGLPSKGKLSVEPLTAADQVTQQLRNSSSVMSAQHSFGDLDWNGVVRLKRRGETTTCYALPIGHRLNNPHSLMLFLTDPEDPVDGVVQQVTVSGSTAQFDWYTTDGDSLGGAIQHTGAKPLSKLPPPGGPSHGYWYYFKYCMEHHGLDNACVDICIGCPECYTCWLCAGFVTAQCTVGAHNND